MYAGEDYESFAGLSFDDGRGSIRKLCDRCAPSGQLRTIFPINIQRGAFWKRKRDRVFVNPFELVCVKVESHASGEVHSVVNGETTVKSASADSQIMHSIPLNGGTNVCRCLWGEILSDRDGIATRYDQEFVASKLLLAHRIQLT